MTSEVAPRLRGMTWRHDRAVAPLEACSRIWSSRRGVEISWDARSLQDFETYPLEELATRYDLLVIDHPHIGVAAERNCLLPFERDQFQSADYIGQSLASYVWQDRLWALPIDAATQVQAFRIDRVGAPLRTYAAAIRLDAGALAIPLLPPHGLLSLLTLYHQSGARLEHNGFEPQQGAAAFQLLLGLVERVDPWCHTADPIAVLEAMSEPGASIEFAPIVFGYVSYAMPGYRASVIAFADLPVVNAFGVAGSVLGGTGIAVSASCSQPAEAVNFARWVAGHEAQTGPYVDAAGQPAHRKAWASQRANNAASQFFAATRQTLEGAWVRPRHAGFIEFQSRAAEFVNDSLLCRRSGDQVVAELNEMFRKSLEHSTVASQVHA